MKTILAALLAAPCAAATFQPCPRPIDAPPIRLTIINTQTPGLECAKHGAAAEKPCENFSREPGTEGDE